MIVDSFAGGGGASTGIEMALGRSPDVAINHDPAALAMHEANHPKTRHMISSIYAVDPAEVCGGRPVGLAWFSPDCKHHSKAKGGKPVSKNIRDLAWVVVHWAERVRPQVIALENVEEFQGWCPLTPDDRPDLTRKGDSPCRRRRRRMTHIDDNRLLSAQLEAALKDLQQLREQNVELCVALADITEERDRLRDELARLSGVPFRVLDGGKP
jgi:site-specific DNA-cytosine methylase